MTESPIQTLRRAAGLLRSYANMASPGPWRTHNTHVPGGGCTAGVLTGEGDNVSYVAWMPSFSNDPNEIDRQAYPDAIYVAAMHPGVALPLADWLDAEAAVHEAGMQASEALCVVVEAAGAGEHRVQVHASTLDQALAVARSILGEEAHR